MSEKDKRILEIERNISDGFEPNCPGCNKKLSISKKREGASGSIAYSYKCSNISCELKPQGLAITPWYSVLVKALQKRAVQLILAMIGSITVTSLIAFSSGLIKIKGNEDKDSFDTHINKLTSNAENNFYKQQLTEILRQYKEVTTQQHLDSFNRENVYFMKRAAESANVSIEGIGGFDPETWNRELYLYTLANIRAVERGVDVKRIFIIPSNFKDESKLKRLVEVMKEQSDKRVKVFYAFQDELLLDPIYEKRTLAPCALFDGKYLGFNMSSDTFTSSVAVTGRITWNVEEIKNMSPFPDIWRSRYVRTFNDQAEKTIRSYFKMPL